MPKPVSNVVFYTVVYESVKSIVSLISWCEHF